MIYYMLVLQGNGVKAYKIFNLEHSLGTVVCFIYCFSGKFSQYIGKDKIEGLCKSCPVKKNDCFKSDWNSLF